MIGEKGEIEVWKLLLNHQKIKFEKLSRNWEEIEELQIDIYAETAKNVYFIEVKNWSEGFYHSPKGIFHQEKIWEQQIWRKEKIIENFASSKTIIYLITFPSGELANDFRGFLSQKQDRELLVVHHDQVHGKVWENAYDLKRIDDFIYEKEKAFRSRKLKVPNSSLVKIINKEKIKNDY
ncbi:MAG: hypothetical protein MRECE_60c001 [Mycoplasmataceae bacterium CE_OT135]|nr:MAG: hypothetical protein MRECE_60c001 [Mycoplasmataceae bacterium CE_OT135]